MVLTQEELDHWNMDMLKNYLNERGISLSGGGSKKADLIRKVLAADLLQLPITYAFTFVERTSKMTMCIRQGLFRAWPVDQRF